jgi:hypothetical protein
MVSNFEVKYCYYGMRETLVTHITNVLELAKHLSTTPDKLRGYFEDRLNTSARIEGKTLKVKGLLIKPTIDQIIYDLSKC